MAIARKLGTHVLPEVHRRHVFETIQAKQRALNKEQNRIGFLKLQANLPTIIDQALLGESTGVRRLQKSVRWTCPEIEFLQANYVRFGCGGVAENLRRPYDAVQNKARKLGLAGASRWTDADVRYLQANYHRLPLKDISATIGRSVYAIETKAHDLHLPRKNNYTAAPGWSSDDEQYLIANYARLGRERCALTLGRSVHATNLRAGKLGLTRKQLKAS